MVCKPTGGATQSSGVTRAKAGKRVRNLMTIIHSVGPKDLHFKVMFGLRQMDDKVFGPTTSL